MATITQANTQLNNTQHQQHSTRPESWEDQRSYRICQIMDYNWIIIPSLLAILYPIAYRLFSNPNTIFYVPIDDTTTWTPSALIWLAMVLPAKPFHHFSMLATCWPCRPFRLTNKPAVRPFNRLLICLVTRGEQEDVVRRSILPVQDIVAHIDPKISLHILTEEVNAHKFRNAAVYAPHVQVHGVPKSYTPRFAKHKARSLEWFRVNMCLRDDDWVLHIDEETLIDAYLLRTCITYITRQTHCEIGTGVIHYNSNGYFSSIIPQIGDLSRVQDDWGRGQFLANVPHRATLGIHGAFFLASGKVENAVSWETAHLTEDYWFLLGAMKKGFRIGWVPAIAREVSPRSIGDYVKQRRRWYTGVRTLGQWEGRWVLFAWFWGFVELFYNIWTLASGTSERAVPRWLFSVIVFEWTCFRLFSFLTVLVQDWDAGVPFWRMVYSQALAQLLRPYVDLLDSYAAVVSVLKPDQTFQIINKS
ncbi:hypothetical protein EJ05DRAFT_22765 [Pseudovirgaria hyperparasitica]|uniref:Glycosyltransferase 2-like domain-containing protein n=1 Tax=Pseudovirgaria hyperparasitica TaxID=470096 RepID=A0A6A6WLH3_9PEZI|nr:uncharacterized protein EJ05DRAFT_22765 [Pseudovirgaria hyperparasitica]KAF2762996.1 hypothetical protein EJ05DRAFT_22765 [Pseudovirgaria hyperparasitica]